MRKLIEHIKINIKKIINKDPIITAAVMFGFALSYGTAFNRVFDASSLIIIIFAFMTSYIFIRTLYYYFDKFLMSQSAKLIRKPNPLNILIMLLVPIISNGAVLFIDLMDFDLKYLRRYSALKRKLSKKSGYIARYSITDEGKYRAIFTLGLIALTSLTFIAHSVFPNIIIDFLFRLSVWSMIWSVIPVAGIFGLLTMSTKGPKVLSRNILEEFPESGGTRLFVGQRRMWPFFAAFCIFFGAMLLLDFRFFDSLISSTIIGLTAFILWLIYFEFSIKKSVIK